jgi:hypothetical protein
VIAVVPARPALRASSSRGPQAHLSDVQGDAEEHDEIDDSGRGVGG